MNTHLYYDELAGEWKPATLEELTSMNDPELLVCQLDKNGTPGIQLPYKDLVKQNLILRTAKAKKAQEPLPEEQQKFMDYERIRTYRFVRRALSALCSISLLVLLSITPKIRNCPAWLTDIGVIITVITVGAIIYAILGGIVYKSKK